MWQTSIRTRLSQRSNHSELSCTARMYRLKQLGPGLLFAAAAIGVSHLVQSTRAGAEYSWGLLWALLLANFFKFPFFEFTTRYTATTGKSVLQGYYDLHPNWLRAYTLLSLGTMFTIQTAVTVVTAGIAEYLFGPFFFDHFWVVVISLLCLAIIVLGKFYFLDIFIKAIMIVLALSTTIAFLQALQHPIELADFKAVFPTGSGLLFLVAFMGWMPAPLDVSIWQSLWWIDKSKLQSVESLRKNAAFDFRLGYWSTLVMGIFFLGLGALILHPEGRTFPTAGVAFAEELIGIYQSQLGNGAMIIIGFAALTAMFSTTLTTLDASPKAMASGLRILFPNRQQVWTKKIFWLGILFLGTLAIFFFLTAHMGRLITVATLISFLSSPLLAYLNYRLVFQEDFPESARPSKGLKLLSFFGLVFLTGFCILYLWSLIYS